MEVSDEIAYNVLKNNFNILCIVDMDVRKISHEATQKGVISAEEKRAVWQTASKDGISAGVGKMITCIMAKSRNGIFQLFLEVLDGHSDLKFWADCLRDEYNSAKQASTDGINPSNLEQLKLKRSMLKQEPALPSSEYQEPVEKTLFVKFKQSKGESLGDVRAILASNRQDLRKIRDSSKQSLLHVACETMNLDVVKLLVEDYKFDSNVQDARGNTPLHLACYARKTDCVSYLLNFCNPNIRNFEGQTPLHVAGLAGPASLLVHLLVCDRADRNIEDHNGKSAVMIIASNPQLAWCLNRKMSSASLTAQSGRKNSREEIHEKVHRNTSTSSNSYKSRDHPVPTGAVPTQNFSSGKDQSSYPISATNGDHGNGVNKDLKEEDYRESKVVFRDKSKMQSQSIENVTEVEETCCLCCCQPKFVRHSTSSKQQNCTAESIDRFCKMWIVVSFLLFGILAGLSLIVALAYFLATDD